MHELGIMQSALEMAEEKARAAGATEIHRIRLRVGALSGVASDALRFAYEALKINTLAAKAALEIEEIPATCWCQGCEKEFTTANLWFECPHCHQTSGQLRHGNELELTSLEIS
jgi:hydrogenase nickel incorporation protein HypA/HybF